MKKTLILLTLWALAIPVWAQTAARTPVHGPKNPVHHQVHERIRQEIRQIEKNEKSGKITHQQALAAKTQLKSVHDQQKAFTQQNHGGDLTPGQAKQLNQSLDGVAASN